MSFQRQGLGGNQVSIYNRICKGSYQLHDVSFLNPLEVNVLLFSDGFRWLELMMYKGVWVFGPRHNLS